MERESISLTINDDGSTTMRADRVHVLANRSPMSHDLIDGMANPTIHVQVDEYSGIGADFVRLDHEAPAIAAVVMKHGEAKLLKRLLMHWKSRHGRVKLASSIEIDDGNVGPDKTIPSDVAFAHGGPSASEVHVRRFSCSAFIEITDHLARTGMAESTRDQASRLQRTVLDMATSNA